MGPTAVHRRRSHGITRQLLYVFALSGAAVVLLSGLGAAVVAAGRRLRPFNRFVDYMGAGRRAIIWPPGSTPVKRRPGAPDAQRAHSIA